MSAHIVGVQLDLNANQNSQLSPYYKQMMGVNIKLLPYNLGVALGALGPFCRGSEYRTEAQAAFLFLNHWSWQVELGGGVSLSALNIPGECRPFGFEKYWLDKQKAVDRRALRGVFSPGMWLMKDTKRTDPEACDKYVEEASAAGTLFDHQSEHASFQITAPDLSLRVNIGKVHQLAMRDPTDKFDLPDHVACQMNVAFEAIDVSDTTQVQCYLLQIRMQNYNGTEGRV